MTSITRLMSVAVLAALMTVAAVPVRAQLLGGPAVAAQSIWDSMWAGTAGALDYGATVVRALTGWFVGSGPAGEVGAEDARGLLNLSDKEFREFDGLVRAAGYVLQGYSFGLDGISRIELEFDFERAVSERERVDLRHVLDQQGGVVNVMRRSVILALLDATRYIDAPPAAGYRLAGVSVRPQTPPEVRVRFRRSKP